MAGFGVVALAAGEDLACRLSCVLDALEQGASYAAGGGAFRAVAALYAGCARGDHELCGEVGGCVAEGTAGVAHDVLTEAQVRAAANDCTHAEGQGTAEQCAGLAGQESADEHIADGAFDAEHLAAGGVAEQHAPLVGDAACLTGLQEHGVHELGAFVTEHDCHDHRAGGFGVVHVHAVQFCDCLGVEGGAFEVAADCERGQTHGGDGAYAGHECGCAGDAADGGDVAQVGAVEALVDL